MIRGVCVSLVSPPPRRLVVVVVCAGTGRPKVTQSRVRV